MTRNALKQAIFAGISVIIGTVMVLALGEITCRILPVNEGMRVQPVTAADPVFRFEPDRSAVFAKGALFDIVNRVRTNNAGFVSDQPYDATATTPLLTLIGDSYVEALMVPYADTLQARLASVANGSGRVYAFAASGAGLAQYLVWARYSRDVYRPQGMSIVIIPNDFSESIYEREHSPGFHSFVKRQDGSAELRLTEYQPSAVRLLLRNSALAMYLFSQAKVQTLAGAMGQALGDNDTRFVGNVAADAPEDYRRASEWAVDRFLDLLPESAGLDRSRIQLVVESVRPNLYAPETMPEAERSYWGRMRRYVIENARSRGHDVVDLQPAFSARYQQSGKRFEFPTDGHWNAEGHAAAAEAVQASRLFRQLFTGR